MPDDEDRKWQELADRLGSTKELARHFAGLVSTLCHGVPPEDLRDWWNEAGESARTLRG